MARPGEYEHRGVAASFEAQDISVWDTGDDHKVTVTCDQDLTSDASLDIYSLLVHDRGWGTYSSVNYVSLLPNLTDTNIVCVIGGKGTGGIQAQVSDGTATGGNNRGNYAVDLQQDRDNADEVASASGSVIVGGRNNRASATYAMAGGDSSIASGDTASAFGENAEATGTHSHARGRDVVADGAYSHVTGRQTNAISRYGVRIHGSGRLSSDGDCQTGDIVLRGISTSATPITLTSDGSGSASATNQLALEADKVIRYEGWVVAHDMTNNQVGAYAIEGLIKREAGVASTTSLSDTVATEFENLSGLDVTLSADTTNGALGVSFTGVASKTYHVGCYIYWLEVA